MEPSTHSGDTLIMIREIVETYRSCTWDFRDHACPDDPLNHLFEEWVDYYRMKWAIARVLKPATILEIGVRYGYSARAFLEGSPDARYVGIDADVSDFGGQPGAPDWAIGSLSGFTVSMVKANTQDLLRLPGTIHDLIHVDGQQDGDGTFHDLELSVCQSRYILLDGYFWTRENHQAANEWMILNKSAIEWAGIIPGYAGELLIKINADKISRVLNKKDCDPENGKIYSATAYYLKDGGDYQSRLHQPGKIQPDSRLQAVADVAMAVVPEPGQVLTLGDRSRELACFFDEAGVKEATVDNLAGALSPATTPDLAVVSDLIEHLSPSEVEDFLRQMSCLLEPEKGALILHTAPNQWYFVHEQLRRKKSAAKAGFWLPRVRRTWYEKIMQINPQAPQVLKRQLSRHFLHVLLWFSDEQSPGGSLLRPYGILDMRRAGRLFAVASHGPIDREKIRSVFCLPPLTEEEAGTISLRVADRPEMVSPDEEFFLPVILRHMGTILLTSSGSTPMHLSYHWTDPSGNCVIHDGVRTVLQPSARPGRETRYLMRVKAPQNPGRYFLWVLPVQETIRWHEPADSVSIDIVVRDGGR